MLLSMIVFPPFEAVPQLCPMMSTNNCTTPRSGYIVHRLVYLTTRTFLIAIGPNHL
jgi:hypothetical protein